MKTAALLCLVSVLLPSLAAAQSPAPLVDEALAELFHEEFSGELAKEHVIAITRHHRIQGSRGYRDSAQWLLSKLREYGYGEDEAWIESFPSDGRVRYQTWQSPSGWDIDAGELRMVSPHEERIVGYPEIAMSVMTYSNAGEVTAPLVWVGSGTRDEDYAGKDVAGKIVLGTGYGGAVHRKAVIERGAAAVVCYLDDARAAQYPDMLAYTGMWPRTEELERVTFGFNLTNRQGERLRRLLEAGEDNGGEVVLKGRVTGRGLEPYFMDVVVLRIEGTEHPEDELVFSAHLDHPKESANDNASGSAALLDMARGLAALVDDGRLEPTRRTLRFLWVPEFFGTMAYVDAHPEMVGVTLGGRVLANMNMDMVGEDTEQLHCRLELTRTPDSLPSVVNDVVADVAALVDRMDVRTPRGSLAAFNYRVTPYAPGSDHMVFIDRKVPGVMFWHTPDYTHHTSEDTPDKVDPVELERCEILATSVLWYLANLDETQALDLVAHTAGRSAGRLGEAARRAQRLLMSADVSGTDAAWAQAANALAHAFERERASLVSVLSFRDDAPVRAAVEVAQQRLAAQRLSHARELAALAQSRGATSDVPPAVVDAPDARVPQRLTRGMLDFGLPESGLPDERAAFYAAEGRALTGLRRFEAVNLIDGTRTAGEITAALMASTGAFDAAVLSRYLDDLVSVGVVAWVE